jgi:RNA polymerase sigma-70 factor, ECF subfamily
LTDEKVIASVLAGNTSLFKELVKRYESRVAGVVIGMLGPGPEAEDAGQEVFIRFYRSLASFRGESGVATYLTRIAIRVSLNEIKRRKRRFGLFSGGFDESRDEAAEPPGEGPSPDAEAVQSALLRLKPDLRAVAVLRFIEGRSTEETAAILNIPAGTVLSRLSRAKTKLKKILTLHLGGSVWTKKTQDGRSGGLGRKNR